MQEIYLEVFRFLPSLKDNMAFCAWLRSVAYHCCLKAVRKQKETSIGDEKVEHIKKLLNQKPLPSDSFTSVKTPEIKLQTESLKGIEIPKPKPVQKKKIILVYMRVLKEDEKQKRLTAYVQGDVDYRNTYLETEDGEWIYITGYSPEKQVIYFPVQKKSFILHLSDIEGKQQVYRLKRMKK